MYCTPSAITIHDNGYRRRQVRDPPEQWPKDPGKFPHIFIKPYLPTPFSGYLETPPNFFRDVVSPFLCVVSYTVSCACNSLPSEAEGMASKSNIPV